MYTQTSASQQIIPALIRAVAAEFGVSPTEIAAPSRRKAPVAQARQVAMYLAHVIWGLTYEEVGQGFKRDRTTVSHGVRLIEDLRDDPTFDNRLACLEDIAQTLMQHADTAQAPWGRATTHQRGAA